MVEDELSDDAITGRMRVYQRVRGHRYSLDDVITAWEAARAVPDPERYLDMGCGIGSVLLMVVDCARARATVGIEAQEISFALAERNVERNGLRGRVRLVRGDLRDEALRASVRGERFDLVTGTPPYAPPGTSTPSPDSQRTHARIEMRGGIEDYLMAASTMVKPSGTVVVCAAGGATARVVTGARAAGLTITRQRDVVPRAERGVLLAVWTLRLGEPAATWETTEPFVVRDAQGERTEAAKDLRAFFGLEEALGNRS